MVSSVGSPNPAIPEATVYRRKEHLPISTKVDPSSVRKPRLGGLAPPEILAQIKQMSAAAKGAQAQYNAMAKQAAEMNAPPSDFLIAVRQSFGLDPFGKPLSNAQTDPLSALFVDTKV